MCVCVCARAVKEGEETHEGDSAPLLPKKETKKACEYTQTHTHLDTHTHTYPLTHIHLHTHVPTHKRADNP